MKEHFTEQKSFKDKGFSLVEIVVIIAIMIVLLAILTPSILRYVENSRMQKDDSAMDEVCHGILYALSDSEIFDEAVSYSIPNNYVTYTDSSGVYGAKYIDEEFWAPDGSGNAVTITFNPDENGTYTLADGLVNDMTYGNGSVADTRTADGLKQCYFSEMGQQKLYHKVEQTVGSTFSEKSATYKNSSYTVFITFDVVNGIKRADVYGEWNGTNLDESCPASLGSGTSSYVEEEPIQTKPGGTTQSNYTSSDLQGSGGTSGRPSYKPCSHLQWIVDSNNTLQHICTECALTQNHEYVECVCVKCGAEEPHEHNFVNYECTICGKPDYPILGQSVNLFGEPYLIVKTDEEAQTVTLITLRNASSSKMAFSTSLETTMFDNGREGIKYAGSTLDIFLNDTFYNSQRMDAVRPYIIPTPIYQSMFRVANVWSGLENGNYGIPADTTFWYSTISNYHCHYKGQVYVGERYVYAPDLMDVATYFGAEVGKGQKIPTPFTLTGSGYSYPDGVLTRSASYYGPTYAVESETSYSFGNYSADRVRGATRAMFTIDWDHLPKTAITHICEGGTATCTAKAICKWCNQEYGNMKSHTGGTRTCQQKSICTTCGQEYGNLASCTGGTATCQQKAICQWCNQEYGNIKSCTGGTATCIQRAVCQWCGQEYGNLQNHSGGIATCKNKAICAICYQEYGDLGAHVAIDGVCSICGKVVTEFETAHNYPNSQNYIVLGQWDYSNAKSVNITIEYETESTSFDWISIVDGHDYTAGSSYSQTKNYLNTNGNIISTTGINSSIKFGGNSRTIKTFQNVNMLKGTIVFRSDGSVQKWGAKVTITPNY